MNIVLHFGTLLATIIYFWKDLLKAIDWRFVKLGFVSSVPTAIIGLMIKKYFDFDHVALWVVAMYFALSGLAVFITHIQLRKHPSTEFTMEDVYKQINYKIAFLIGIGQGLAALPGLSRSGSTIAVAALFAVTGPTALFYSFAISIPAVAGAVLLELHDAQIHDHDILPYILGSSVAFAVGMGCLFLMKYLFTGKARLDFFSYYLWILTAALLIL